MAGGDAFGLQLTTIAPLTTSALSQGIVSKCKAKEYNSLSKSSSGHVSVLLPGCDRFAAHVSQRTARRYGIAF